jgi:hypothetical protein
VDGEIVALSGGHIPRERAGDPLPLTLRQLVFRHPEALRQPHVDLRLVGPPVRLVGGTAHAEAARRAPAQFDTVDLAFLARF